MLTKILMHLQAVSHWMRHVLSLNELLGVAFDSVPCDMCRDAGRDASSVKYAAQ